MKRVQKNYDEGMTLSLRQVRRKSAKRGANLKQGRRSTVQPIIKRDPVSNLPSGVTSPAEWNFSILLNFSSNCFQQFYVLAKDLSFVNVALYVGRIYASMV